MYDSYQLTYDIVFMKCRLQVGFIGTQTLKSVPVLLRPTIPLLKT